MFQEISFSLQIRLGDRDLSLGLDDHSVEVRDIKGGNVSFHPKYRFGESYFDLAVIEFDPPIKFSMAVRPICLPSSPSSNQEEFKGDLVRVTGQFFFHGVL